MRIKIFYTILFAAIITISLYSQQNSAPIRLLVMEDVVKPANEPEYEKAQKEMNEFIVKNKMGLTWNAFKTEDGRYMYAVMFSTFSQLDSIFAIWDVKSKNVNQDELSKMVSAFAGKVEKNNSYVLKYSEKGSYKAIVKRLKDDEAGFVHFDVFELIPGKEKEYWSVVPDYIKLCEKNQLSLSFETWVGEIGSNTTSVICATYAKDDVDFYKTNKADEEKLGSQVNELYMKMTKCLTNFFHFNGRVRPDLSILPK